MLVNNAGYGSFGALEDVPLDEARRQFEVNVFGAARLCQLVLPQLRAQGAGRIINVSSIGAKMYQALGGWYHSTKYALEGLSDCLRLELKPLGIDVVLIQPGGIETEFPRVAGERLLATSGDGAYADAARSYAATLMSETGGISSPAVVAGAIARRRRCGIHAPATRSGAALRRQCSHAGSCRIASSTVSWWACSASSPSLLPAVPNPRSTYRALDQIRQVESPRVS